MLLKNSNTTLGWMTIQLSVFQLVAWGILYYSFSVLLPAMEKDLHWSTTILSGGFSVAILVSGLLAPFVGSWIDQNGAKRLMVCGSFCGVFGVLAWSQSTSLLIYYFGWLLIGLSMATTLYAPTFAMVVRLSGRESRNQIATIAFAGALASTLFLPLMAYLSDRLGWRWTLVVLAGIMAGFTLSKILFLPSDKNRSAIRLDQSDDSFQGKTPIHQNLSIVLAILLMEFASTSIAVFAISFLIYNEMSLQMASALFGFGGVSKLIGRFTTLIKIPALPFLCGSQFLCAFGIALPIIYPSWTTNVLMILIFGATNGIHTILKPMIIVEKFGYGQFGKINGSIQFLATLLKSTAPFLMSLAILQVGWEISWGSLAVTVFASALLFCFVAVNSKI